MVITPSGFEDRHGLLEVCHLADGSLTMPLGHSGYFHCPLDSAFSRVQGLAQRVYRCVARRAGLYVTF